MFCLYVILMISPSLNSNIYNLLKYISRLGAILYLSFNMPCGLLTQIRQMIFAW